MQTSDVPARLAKMDAAGGFTPFEDQLKSTLVQVSQTVKQLSSEDLSFHRTWSSEFSDALDEQSDRFLALTSGVLKAATAGTDVAAPVLRNEESIEDNWRGVVDVIDALLEKADACLDEFTGVIKKLSPSQEERASLKKAPPNFPTIYDYGPSKIPKPQLLFENKPDNYDAGPWRPLLQTKPHAIVPLEESLKQRDVDGATGYPNPYDAEIRAAQYPKSVCQVAPPIDYLPFESTTATFVDTLDGVKEMLAELKKAKEIAIDLEHHDVHSYHGLVSLMQISTRDKDWVVDTLKPWREKLQLLNEVFADPRILKILHGSSMDIIWLQRDLGLYVVGMFDTFHAASTLGYPKRSLKFLLNKFANFEADKRYQMADWRIRPLPSGMFEYARSDTHYLLYIYDRLRNDLIEDSTPKANKIDYVQERSKMEALQRYERPVYDTDKGLGAGGWYDLLSRNSGTLSKEQFAVFKAVHQWRDEVARAEDEGWQCVFPKHVLFKLAQAMPPDLGTLFKTLSPVTPITKDRAHDLLAIIKNAKIAGATGPEWRDVAPPKAPAHAVAGVDIEVTDFPSAERYETSQFWGTVLEVRDPSLPPEYSLVAASEALRLSLPLPQMPSTVTTIRNELGTSATNQPAPVPIPAPTSTAAHEERDNPNKIFTVKELGGPRKRKVAPTDTTEQPPSTPDAIDDTSDDPDSISRRRKKSRKDKKSKKSAQADSQSKSDGTPFDYGAAESVFNAPSVNAPSAPAPTGQPPKRAFNPYAKAMDAPSGVRKTKHESGGKSLTFRK